MSWTDWSENIFDSIGLIAKEIVNQNLKEKIELATIEQIQGKNKYLVDNGSIKYVAYGASGTIYNQNDKVYVMILQGDYENKKLIMGDYSYKTESDLISLSPGESFVNMSGNLLQSKYIPEGQTEEKPVTFELIANGGNHFNPNTASKSYFLKDADYTTQGKDYDSLYVSAGFKTKFDLVQGDNGAMVKGNYGLMISGKETDPSNNSIKDFHCFLDTKDMFGDYYNFDSYMKQEKKFKIDPSKIYNITKVQLFQNVLGWDEEKEEPIIEDYGFKRLSLNENEENIYKTHNASDFTDIFARGIEVCFGYSLEKYKTDTVLLWTDNKLEYSGNDDNSRKGKILQVRFIYFQEDGNPIVVEDINDERLQGKTIKVHWYRYNEELKLEESSSLAGKGWIELENSLNQFERRTNLQSNVETDKYKVIITVDGQKYSSEILIFENVDLIEKLEMLEGVNVIYPSNDSNSGQFYFYSDVDKTASSGNYNKERTLETVLLKKDGDNVKWSDGDILVWLIPSTNTMIRKPEVEDLEEGTVFIEPGGKTKKLGSVSIKARSNYYVIAKEVKIKNEEVVKETISLKYKLKKTWTSNKNRNTIVCYYYMKGMSKRHSKDEVPFTFGTQGTNGSEFSLDIEWTEVTQGEKKYNNPPAMTWKWDSTNNKLNEDKQSTKSWKFKPVITNKSGEVVSSDNVEITLNFYKSVSVDGDSVKADDFLEIKNNNTISIKDFTSFPKKEDGKINGDLVRILPYTLLKFKATGKVDKKYINLTKVIPLAFRSKRKFVGLRGPTEIIYGADGYNPKMNDDEGYEIIVKKQEDDEDLKIKEWKIFVYDKGSNEKKNNDYPQIIEKVEDGVTNYYLKPSNVYTPHENTNYTYSAVGVRARGEDGSYLWAQPIYVTYNAYSVGFLNNWDGGTYVDENAESNSEMKDMILSSLIGAGIKEENKFSGVVLGDLRKAGSTKSSRTGILGFDKGIQTFSLSSKGEAIFGQNELIYISGKKGTISSKGKSKISDVVNDKKGIFLDLINGDAAFGGTIYATNGEIGGWTIEDERLSAETNGKHAILKPGGDIGLALGCSEDSASSGVIQLFHNGRAKFGYLSKDNVGAIIEPDGTVKLGNVKGRSPGLTLDKDGSIEGRYWGITADGEFYLRAQSPARGVGDFVSSNPQTGKFSIKDPNGGYFFEMGYGTNHPHVSGLNVGNSHDNGKTYPVAINAGGIEIAPKNGEGKFLCTPDAKFSSHIKTLQGVYIHSNYNNPSVGSIEINGDGISLKGINYIQTSNDKIGASIEQIKFISNISKGGIGISKYYKHVRTMTFENGILVGITSEVQEEI